MGSEGGLTLSMPTQTPPKEQLLLIKGVAATNSSKDDGETFLAK